MAKGSNDLNMLLKSQVVKIRAELDVTGSLPKIKEQIKNISTRLEKNPVKLQVKLDYRITELNKQLKTIQTALSTAKTVKPIKIKVDIDVAGSATAIKRQLQDIYKIVGDFNKKYGEQINRMNRETQKALGAGANVGKAVAGNAMIGGFDTKVYASQIKEARDMMKSMFGKGNFTSTQFKDAEGNLRGFVAQLEKANGVVQKIRYDWNSEAGKFMPINQQTIDGMEKHVNRASKSLRGLYAEIEKLGEGQGQHNLFKQYEDLEKRIGNGTLTQDAVKALQVQIKEEQVLQQNVDKTNKEYIERQDLIRKTTTLMNEQWKKNGDVNERKEYKAFIEDIKKGNGHLADQKLRYREINDEIKKNNRSQKEVQENTKKRMQLMKQIREIERSTPSSDKTSQRLIGEIKLMAQRANSGKEWIEIQKKMNALHHSNANANELRKTIDLQDKLTSKIRELGRMRGQTAEQTERHIRSMQQTALRGYADLERMYYKTNKQIKDLRAENKRAISEGKVLLSGKPNNLNDAMLSNSIKTAVNQRDVQMLQTYIGQLYNGRVETVKMEQTTDELGRAVDRMKVKMAGAGKTVKTYMVDLDRANGELRQVQQGLDYNANRNLGAFEQLKIAMARVPVWMTAMTAFYGSLRTVRAMSREILEVDKALTELKRVASSDISIERVFSGAVELSKTLGNNVHDVMQTMNDFSRTFGEFNERQLLAITNTATLMSNVSELGAQDAGETLIATMNAFNIEAEESIKIVDAFNEVDNNFAVSTQQLSEGMSKTASTAKTFGVEMEESIGHITAISSVTQESGKLIGNSLKTIYSRITTMKGAENVLKDVNIQINDMEGNVRPVQDILSELGGKWDTLTDSQRQNIGVTLAGRYQLSRFLALMNNWDTAVSATTTALTSQGSAMRENDEYLKSFEARINQLKNGFTELALSVGDAILSDGMMTLIELGKDLAQTIADLVKEFGALPGLFLLIGGLMGKFGYLSKLHTTISNGITGIATAFSKFDSQARNTAKSTKIANDAMKGTATATAGVTGAMTGATVATRTFGTVVKSTLASTGIGLLFVGLGVLIEKLVSQYADAKREAEEFEKQQKKSLDAFHEFGASSGLEEMIDQYAELHKMSDRTIEQEQEYQKLRANLVNNFPTMIDSYDAEGEAILKNVDAMKDEIGALEDISKAKAEVVKIELRQDLEKEIKSWTDLTKEIEDYAETIKKLSKNDGIEVREFRMHDRMPVVPAPKNGNVEIDGNIARVTIDHNETILKQELKMLEAQQKRAGILQNINKRIADQSLAYLEVDGIMSKLSESQIRAIEDYSMSHTKSIEKRIRELNEEGATQEEIADFLEAKADSIASKGTVIGQSYSNAMQEIFKTTDGTQMSYDKVKIAIDAVSESLDVNHYKFKNQAEINDMIRDLAEISYEIGTDGVKSFSDYASELEKYGFTAEQSTALIGQFAKEQQNVALYQEAMKNGFDETTTAIEDMNEAMLESIDLTGMLLGEGYDEELQALESNITAIKLYREYLGKGAEDNWVYQESLGAVATALGLTEEQVLKNSDGIGFLTKITGELNPVLNELGTEVQSFNELSDEQKEMLKQLGTSEEELIKKYIEHNDWMTAILDVLGLYNPEKEKEAENTNKSKEAVEAETQAKEKNKEATEKQKEAIGLLNEKFEILQQNTNQTNKAQWIETVKAQLSELDGQVVVTKDNTGQFKLAMADGSTSPWLSTLQEQLETLGIKIGVADDGAGNLKLVLNDGTGSSTLVQIGDDAENAKVVLDETAGQLDIIQQKTLPNNYSQIDFVKLFTGLDSTTQKVQVLSEWLQGVWDNAQEVIGLQEVFQTLQKMTDVVSDAISKMFESSAGTLDDLKKKAEEAKASVDNLKVALAQLNNKSREITLDPFKDLISKAGSAQKAIERFKISLDGITGKMISISGASMIYTGVLSNINLVTLNSIGAINGYANSLLTLSANLVNVTTVGAGVITSQRLISESMRAVVGILQSYNATITNSSANVQTAYMRMAIAIVAHTATIMKAYNDHGKAVINLAQVTEKTWNRIISAINNKGNMAVNAVRKMADAMHKAFKDRMDDIVKVAESLPGRIGKGVRDHMTNASSAMDAVAKDMVKRFKKELGIHSPSRVFEELGGWVIKGLANGLTGSDLKSLGKDVFDDFGGGALSSFEDIKDFLQFGALGMNPNFGGTFRMSSGFGMRTNPVTGIHKLHAGTDYAAPMGTPIPAQTGGQVVRSGYVGGFGNMVEVRGVNGMSYIYAHNSRNNVKVGDTVKKGQILGLVGSTGNSTGPHVHYEVRKNGRPINARGKFANGGFIEEHMIAEMGEEGVEAIIPLVPQRRDRGIELWEETGQRLGIDTGLIDMLLSNRRSGGGVGAFFGGGGFGGLSGEGGSAEGGGGSGTSGVVQPSVYEGGMDFDGTFEFTALDKEALYKYNARERQADGYNHNIDMIESKMNAMEEATLKYRNALKQVLSETKKLLSVEKKDLDQTKKRQSAIEKQLKSLGNTSKHTEAQRKKYNELQQEYERNISKIQTLEKNIESTNQKIKNTSTEIFTDWVDEIVGKYEKAIAGIEAKTDDIDFKLDVLSFTDPDNVKAELDLLAQRANELQKQEATNKNLVNSLQKEYDKAVKKYGKSSKEAKKVKEELDSAKESLEDITLEVLQAEKDILDTRGKVADRGIKQLQDYYKNVKDMAMEAIEMEKRELQKAHEEKMNMYDKEIEKINSVYDNKLKQMDKEKAQAEYQEQLDEKSQQRAEIVNKISLLSRDTSLEGRKRVEELRKELADINDEISTMMKDRQDELLRQALEQQKEDQIAKIESQKETETEEYDSKVEKLDKEASDISKHYDDMLNDEKYWADMRENFIKGSFSTLTQELEMMSKSLADMSQGNFDGLTSGFSKFSDELKEEFADMFNIDISNLNFNNDGLLNQVNDAQKSKYGVYIGNGSSFSNPDMTTWTEPKPAPAPKPKPTPATPAGKPLKVGGKAKVAVNGAKAYMDSYGRQVKDWSAQAKAAGVGYGDPMYVVHQRGGYVALAKRNSINDAIAWLKEKDVVGLRTGGYTGDWAGDDGKLAMLHKKELVLNERQTSDILDTAKIIGKIKDVLPNVKRNSVFDKLATAGQITNISYGDINVTVENGDKKKAKDIASEIMTGIKKKGR